MITVRRAEASDLPFLCGAEAEIFSDAWHESGILSHLTADYTRSYIAVCDNTPVGYLLSGGIMPESELYRIAVLPDARRTGVGAALLSSYHEDAARDGATVFFLEVREHNAPAVALYTRNGYTVTGIRKNYYRFPTENALCMTKTVQVP